MPLGNRQYFDTPLNEYSKKILSDSAAIAKKGAEVLQRSKGLAGEADEGEPDDAGNPQSRCKQVDF